MGNSSILRTPVQTVEVPDKLVPVNETVDVAVTSIAVNDLADINVANPYTSALQPIQLPTRAEKRFIPQNGLNLFLQADASTRNSIVSNQKPLPNATDFYISAALSSFVDYIIVVVPHRGITTTGVSVPNVDAVYRFLINPHTVQIGRNTEDSQAFTRGGWQFGLWGEGLTHINMSGHTPGQYFSYGLTDDYAFLSESWRNLQQLMVVFENNGYWFEGEEQNEGPMAPGYERRRIKKHQDIQLVVGNNIWWGMFDELNVTIDAEHPYRAEFRISFVGWKERFRQNSPYSQWGFKNNVERGHSYSAAAYPAQEETGPTPAGQQTVLSLTPPVPVNTTIPVAPAVAAANAMETASDDANICTVPMSTLFNNAFE